MIFGRKESRVKETISQHLEEVQSCLRVFKDMMDAYLDGNEFEELSYQVHEREHDADKIRREIEREIYEGAFLPLFREDYITLVELIDKVANRAETVSDIVAQQHPHIPEEMRPGLKKMTATVLECFDPLVGIIEAFDSDWEEASRLAREVEELEQTVDQHEWNMIKELFEREDMELAEKLLARDLIHFTASISDRMEDASDRIDIMLVKRKA